MSVEDLHQASAQLLLQTQSKWPSWVEVHHYWVCLCVWPHSWLPPSPPPQRCLRSWPWPCRRKTRCCRSCTCATSPSSSSFKTAPSCRGCTSAGPESGPAAGAGTASGGGLPQPLSCSEQPWRLPDCCGSGTVRMLPAHVSGEHQLHTGSFTLKISWDLTQALKSSQLKSFPINVCVCVFYWTCDFITHVTEFYFLDLLSSSVRWTTMALKAQITEYFW